VYVTLLDEGTLSLLDRTMYRNLSAQGEVASAAANGTSPVYQKPNCWRGPTKSGHGNITKLMGPVEMSYFYSLCSFLDIFSRRVVAGG